MRRTLRYVALLSAARTPLADFSSILLEIAPPYVSPDLGSGSHAVQMAEVMKRIDPVMEKEYQMSWWLWETSTPLRLVR